ncbi:MAG: hypothetical protein NC925_03580 [Candidatus Omnitrophica bacterium]|nr:hypothetical protein [Candidatus Omnitrophota bacterium]
MNNLERYFVLDVLNEYNETKIRNKEELIKTCREIIKKNDTKFKYSIVIDNDYFLDLTLKILWVFAKYYKKDWWLIAEEASFYAPLNKNSFILNFVKYGRHYNINQVYITRNTAEISRQITSQADVIVSFNQTEPRHLDVLKQYGFDISKVAKLKKFEYITVGDKNILKNLKLKED